MEKQNIITRIKLFISGIGFRLFIWGNDTTQEEYWEQIYQQEKAFKENNNKLECVHPYASVIGEEHDFPKCLACGKYLD